MVLNNSELKEEIKMKSIYHVKDMNTSSLIPKFDISNANSLQRIEEDPKINEYSESMQVTFQESKQTDRGNWGGKLEFILACVSYAVGLGNVWRFPYLCHKNGGGAFLLPYLIMLLLVGIPLFFLEFAFGQFASLGPISVWNMSPLFKGIGYAMVAVSWLLCIYYNVIVAQSIFYLFASFNSKLPWTTCGNEWNNNVTCFDKQSNISSISNLSFKLTSPSEEYYVNNVLKQSSGIDEMGYPSWKLTLCLLLSWTICALVLIKGIQSLGRVSYFTAVFPYVILTALLIHGFFLPGSLDGIMYYLTPNFERLKDPSVWIDAATQIFFSLGCCSGSLIAMSSFNKFKNNCCRDAVIVACINCATSIYAGFVVFSNLGFMAHIKQTDVKNVARSGPGLAFIVYPDAVSQMPLPVMWSILFFVMLSTLGLGSQFPIVETVISGMQDEMRRFGYIKSKLQQTLFRILFCFFNFLLGIPMLCNGGYYLLFLIDWSMSGYPLLFICLCELCVICYGYGLSQFLRDIELMINERPNWFWRISWMFTTPAVTLSLIVFSIFFSPQPVLDTYTYPTWAVHLANLITAFPLVCIPIWFLYKFCVEGGWILLREFVKPVHEWGPAEEEHRAEFISMIKSNESLKRCVNFKSSASNILTSNNLIPASFSDVETAAATGLAFGSALAMPIGSAVVLPTGSAEDAFFQSKLNVAEKLTQAHTKQMAKRAAAEGSAASESLTASQLALAAMTSSKTIQPYSVAFPTVSPDEAVSLNRSSEQHPAPCPSLQEPTVSSEAERRPTEEGDFCNINNADNWN